MELGRGESSPRLICPTVPNRRDAARRLLRRVPRFPHRFARAGTLPPARRASDSPIAIACLRLVTFLRERPERSVPCFISCMLRCTLLCAFSP